MIALTYVSTDICNPEPFTPSYLLYHWRVQMIPHDLEDTDELDTVEEWIPWISEGVFHRSSGHNQQAIKKEM